MPNVTFVQITAANSTNARGHSAMFLFALDEQGRIWRLTEHGDPKAPNWILIDNPELEL